MGEPVITGDTLGQPSYEPVGDDVGQLISAHSRMGRDEINFTKAVDFPIHLSFPLVIRPNILKLNW